MSLIIGRLLVVIWLNSIYLDISLLFFSNIHSYTPLELKWHWDQKQQEIPREFIKTSWKSIRESCWKENSDSAAHLLREPIRKCGFCRPLRSYDLHLLSAIACVCTVNPPSPGSAITGVKQRDLRKYWNLHIYSKFIQ